MWICLIAICFRYGALMWSLGKVIHTPEVMRVYIGSFQENMTAVDPFIASLFEKETVDLLDDLYTLPRSSSIRKINDILKRTRFSMSPLCSSRQLRVHAHIISTLKREMPSLFGKSAKQAELLDNLPMVFTKVQRQTQLPPGDFPEINHYKSILLEQDFDKFPKMYHKLLDRLEQAISEDLPQLMRDFPPGPNIPPQPIFNPYTNSNVNPNFALPKEKEDVVHSSDSEDSSSIQAEEPVDDIWTLSKTDSEHFSRTFDNLQPVDGKITGNQAKVVFSEAKLPNSELAEIWQLADEDSDGALTLREYMVMMKLVQVRLQGGTIPTTLPTQLKRK